jgi:zinc protease
MHSTVRSWLLPALCLSLAAMSASAQNPPEAAQAPAKSVAKKPAAAKPAQTAKLLPFKVTEKTLANGLKVIIVPTGFPNIVSLQIPVQTGSRNEIEPGKSGFAHFFEHMMFRGTKLYPPDKYNEIITKAGARQNAYTTDDYTNYHITFAKDDLETMLKIEADRFQNLSYKEEDFKTEARAVLGEYNKNSAQPLAKIEEAIRDAAFTTHTYKHTTMGFIKDIEDMPNQFQYSKTFFDRWYRPEYATVMVAGDVDPAKVMPLVEKYFGNWKRGTYKVDVPQEPPTKGPFYTHIPWNAPTLPWITVGFHGPAFSETSKDFASMDLLFELYFGQTSALYKRLVQDEQKVDQLLYDTSATADPGLMGVYARVKKLDDSLYVRNAILETFAKARTEMIDAKKLADAQSNVRYSLARSLDNTDRIASILAQYVRVRRSFDTLNNYVDLQSSLTAADLNAAAKKYLTDNRLALCTLSKEALPETLKANLTVAVPEKTAAASAVSAPVVMQKSPLPQLMIKLLFATGSSHDPAGKEGLAALAAGTLTRGGSAEKSIDEIDRILFPMAGVFRAQTDKEMTVFTLSTHKDNWKSFFDTVLPQILEPGFREDDFRRNRDNQKNALLQDLRTNNEEELGKERLQGNIFAGTSYSHPVLGTAAGIDAITLDDVKAFVANRYSQKNLTIGFSGDVPPEVETFLKTALAKLSAGTAATTEKAKGKMPSGLEVEIVQKETRATAISFGLPIEVNRAHPDFAALSVARSWLGEHRSSGSYLYQRIREIRGMNYGDYAYIEAFPRGMYQFFPDANTGRRSQIFEVWIRPVVPQNAHMALRIALFELGNLIEKGIPQEDFETTRGYLMKNVFLLTATQNHQLGYELDSKWYGIPEYTKYMREKLGKLTRDDVNAAIKKHLSAKNLSIVMITKDAEGLKKSLLSDEFSPITYDADKPAELLAEDKVIGALKLEIKPENVKITPVDEVFAK